MKTNRTFYFILFALVSFSFTYQLFKVGPDEYIQKFRSMNDDFELVYKDSLAHYDLLFTSKELQVIHAVNKGSLTIDEAKEWMQQSENSFDFMLRISIPSSGRQEFLKTEVDDYGYDERLKYYAFALANDITASVDGEIMQLSDYHFERNFGMSPHGLIRLSVPKTKGASELILNIHDRVYGTHTIKFVFDLKKIEKLPKLKHIDKWKS